VELAQNESACVFLNSRPILLYILIAYSGGNENKRKNLMELIDSYIRSKFFKI
jgi:hypothetical protein